MSTTKPTMPPLPEWDDVRDKVDAEGMEALTAIERLVYENEPYVGAAEWRDFTQAALQEAFDLGVIAGRKEAPL
ncbi:hypothetical protein [Bordetella phage vB_BbrM_PHB04]|uniref:Uncharacterized protein n=1 Tax=Bordetella phage vB_BbrM_PHB04 TaxID=2029657 RepID=A0A291L9W5_9CAUD|nr:hypothetical protein HOS14_gp037 [Bordetella phage vB_BbrM_PHB04]ATI15655.1 hypothetical protein [Bordetella phage vB_BbrM_PHB04]